jgi:hypothetical protein
VNVEEAGAPAFIIIDNPRVPLVFVASRNARRLMPPDDIHSSSYAGQHRDGAGHPLPVQHPACMVRNQIELFSLAEREKKISEGNN